MTQYLPMSLQALVMASGTSRLEGLPVVAQLQKVTFSPAYPACYGKHLASSASKGYRGNSGSQPRATGVKMGVRTWEGPLSAQRLPTHLLHLYIVEHDREFVSQGVQSLPEGISGLLDLPLTTW